MPVRVSITRLSLCVGQSAAEKPMTVPRSGVRATRPADSVLFHAVGKRRRLDADEFRRTGGT